MEALLGAARKVLVSSGFEAMTTNRVAEVAGVSIGSLYQYFPSKEALVAELMHRHVEASTAAFVGLADALVEAPLEVAVRGVIGLMIESHRRDPKLHRVLVEQIPRIGGLNQLIEIEERVQRLVRGYLEARRPELRPENLDLAAFVVVETVEALTHAAVLFRPDLLEGDALSLELSEMVVRYLRREKKRKSDG